MAYVVFCEYVNEESVSPALTVPIPDGYRKDDVLFVFPTQDGGNTFTPTAGWESVFAQSQFNANGQRTWGFYKVLTTNDPEPDFVNTSALNENQGAIVMCVRGADTSNPIDASYIHGQAVKPHLVPQVTTTTPNCLLLIGAGNDNQASRYAPNFDSNTYTFLAWGASGGASCMAGFTYQDAAGLTPATAIYTHSGGNGSAYVVAVRDAGANARRGHFRGMPTFIHRFGNAGTLYSPSYTLEAASAIAASIDGLACSSTLPTTTNSNFSTTFIGGNEVDYCWSGPVIQLPSTVDLTDSIFAGNLYTSTAVTTNHRHIIVFKDSYGAWAAFELLRQTEMRALPAATEYVTYVQPGHSVPIYSSGTMDWSSVERIGALIWRHSSLGTNALGTRNFYFRNLFFCRKDSIQFIPGGNQTDSSFSADFWQGVVGQLSGNYGDPYAYLLGSGLLVSKLPFQIGSSSGKMDGSSFASAVEGSLPYAKTVLRKNYNVEPFGITFSLKANPTDSIRLSSSLIAFTLPSSFDIDAGSSPSAYYSFAGLVLSGARVRNLSAGVVINDATLFACFTAEAVGGFQGCTFREPIASPAVAAADPGVLANCRFIQGPLGGHAIEINQPGTFSFVGNTFEGYGLDGTTDAAIYNNSGGHVTLNVSGGGDTPTVRNGVGATTDVVSGAQVSVVGLAAGSQVKVTKVSNGDVLFNGAESGGQVSFSTTYIGAIRIDARKASASPYYKPWFSQANTVSGQTVEITALQELDE